MTDRSSAASSNLIFPGMGRLPRHKSLVDQGPSTTPGWVSYGMWQPQGTCFETFTGSWEVPAAPQEVQQQTLFIHLALQSAQAPWVIMSAAVQWGLSVAGGGAYWALSTYMAKSTTDDPAGPYDTYAGPLVHAQTGQPVDAFFRRFEQMGVPIWECGLGSDSGQTSMRAMFQGGEPQLNIAWGGVLEAYSEEPVSCAQYPDSDSTTFRQLQLTSHGGGALTPDWQGQVAVPRCGRQVEVHGPTTVELLYR